MQAGVLSLPAQIFMGVMGSPAARISEVCNESGPLQVYFTRPFSRSCSGSGISPGAQQLHAGSPPPLQPGVCILLLSTLNTFFLKICLEYVVLPDGLVSQWEMFFLLHLVSQLGSFPRNFLMLQKCISVFLRSTTVPRKSYCYIHCHKLDAFFLEL